MNGIDPSMLAAFNAAPIEDQNQVLDALDETDAGRKRMFLRYGIGAVAGIAVGVLAAKALRK
jgi:hypothetical protein